jgi:hypothetical protein
MDEDSIIFEHLGEDWVNLKWIFRDIFIWPGCKEDMC